MILRRLKMATSASHTALEDQLPLMNVDLSREDYRQFVGRFFGFYAPLEVQLLASSHWHQLAFDYAPGKKHRASCKTCRRWAAPQRIWPQCPVAPACPTAPRLSNC